MIPRTLRVLRVEPHTKYNDGPILTTADATLRTPVMLCRWRHRMCEHLHLEHGKYAYCMAQPDTSNEPGLEGAGTLLGDARPNAACPRLAGAKPENEV